MPSQYGWLGTPLHTLLHATDMTPTFFVFNFYSKFFVLCILYYGKVATERSHSGLSSVPTHASPQDHHPIAFLFFSIVFLSVWGFCNWIVLQSVVISSTPNHCNLRNIFHWGFPSLRQPREPELPTFEIRIFLRLWSFTGPLINQSSPVQSSLWSLSKRGDWEPVLL